MLVKKVSSLKFLQVTSGARSGWEFHIQLIEIIATD